MLEQISLEMASNIIKIRIVFTETHAVLLCFKTEYKCTSVKHSTKKCINAICGFVLIVISDVDGEKYMKELKVANVV